MAKDDSCRIKIYQDQQEKLPLSFGRYKYALETEVCHIKTADYHCDLIFMTKDEEVRQRSKTVYERKSKADIWLTFGGNKVKYEQFKREYNRALDEGLKMIVIVECAISDIYKGHTYIKKDEGITRAKFDGSSMVRKLCTLRARYGLDFVFCKGRLDMQRYMYERWLAECRELKNQYVENKKKEEKEDSK